MNRAPTPGYEAILDKALADRNTPVPVLVRKLFEVMGNAIEEGGSFYRTVFREISRIGVGLEESGPSEQARHRVVGLVVHLLTRGQARGELDPKLDPDDLATAFDSLVFGTLSHWLYADPSRSLRERMLAASRPASRCTATAAQIAPQVPWGCIEGRSAVAMPTRAPTS